MTITQLQFAQDFHYMYFNIFQQLIPIKLHHLSVNQTLIIKADRAWNEKFVQHFCTVGIGLKTLGFQVCLPYACGPMQ